MPTFLTTPLIAISSLIIFQPNLIAEKTTDLLSSPQSMSLSELREVYLEANGGRQNIESIQSIFSAGRITPASSDFNDNSGVLSFRIVRKREGLLRQDVTLSNKIRRQVLVKGEKIWAKLILANGEQISQNIDASERASLIQSAQMESPFLQTQGRPDWVELKGQENLTTPNGEIAAFRLIVLPKSGLPFTEIWLDANHYQEVLVVAKNPSQSQSGLVRSAFFSEYDEVDDVQFPTKIHLYENDILIQTIHVEEMRTNIGIFDSYFSESRFLEHVKAP